ncbi:hypothetical protein IKF57_02750 [Candidatus Saccharibacteria bacterium]|nr:hypothetical protein [Candidatus Saccharibacteria bacterium]
MKVIKQKILPVIMTILMGVGLVTPSFNAAPAYAADKAQAAILTTCADDEDGAGGGIKCVILLVVDILSILIGIAGVIGIVVVGIQYLTAGGNEEQTRKAKRRLFEIVIGIAVYALAYSLLKWLLPGFNRSISCISDTTISLITPVIGA